MDINEVILTPDLMQELYGHSLVVTPDESRPAAGMMPDGEPVKPAYLGSNHRRTVLLVNYPADAFLPDAALNFLTSILQACRMNLADVAIINTARQTVVFTALLSTVPCDTLLLFGVQPATVGLPDITMLTVYPAAGCNIVISPSAEIMNQPGAEGKALKSQLWNSLKKVFML